MQSLSRIVGLLAVPDYQEPILEGLLASIGGLDASLSKEATTALLDTSNRNGPGEAHAPCVQRICFGA